MTTRVIDDALALLSEQNVDYTSFFRALSQTDSSPARDLFSEPAAFDAWLARWLPRKGGGDMERVNPIYVPRNHLVEAALDAATEGDLAPFERLVDAVSRPFEERPGLEEYAAPAPPGFGSGYRTFCGT